MGEDRFSEKTSASSQEGLKAEQDTDVKIQHTLEGLRLSDDNEIDEVHSAGNTEDLTDEMLSEEITVAGMKTDAVPDPIGWV